MDYSKKILLFAASDDIRLLKCIEMWYHCKVHVNLIHWSQSTCFQDVQSTTSCWSLSLKVFVRFIFVQFPRLRPANSNVWFYTHPTGSPKGMRSNLWGSCFYEIFLHCCKVRRVGTQCFCKKWNKTAIDGSFSVN